MGRHHRVRAGDGHRDARPVCARWQNLPRGSGLGDATGENGFFLGGSSTIRGFQEQNLLPEDARATLRNEVANCRALSQSYGCTSGATSIAAGQAVASQGGELSYVGRAELRFPVIAHIDLGLFFEAGDLWLGAPTAFTLRPVAGTGVRYETPIGPLALDIGFNLQPDQVVNEPTFQVHFNVGVF